MSRRFSAVLGNSQKLDGGAMFGNAPKALWSRWAPSDEQNRIDLACRCLLVQDGGRTVLCEAGIGAFFAPELRRRFGVQEEQHVLLENLAALGVKPVFAVLTCAGAASLGGAIAADIGASLLVVANALRLLRR